MNDTDILELKRDIQIPGSYTRAGTRRTPAEWRVKCPHLPERWGNEWNDWFINLSAVKPAPGPVDLKREIIKEVFDAMHLYSITYKEAASKCMDEYLKRANELPKRP